MSSSVNSNNNGSCNPVPNNPAACLTHGYCNCVSSLLWKIEQDSGKGPSNNVMSINQSPEAANFDEDDEVDSAQQCIVKDCSEPNTKNGFCSSHALSIGNQAQQIVSHAQRRRNSSSLYTPGISTANNLRGPSNVYLTTASNSTANTAAAPMQSLNIPNTSLNSNHLFGVMPPNTSSNTTTSSTSGLDRGGGNNSSGNSSSLRDPQLGNSTPPGYWKPNNNFDQFKPELFKIPGGVNDLLQPFQPSSSNGGNSSTTASHNGMYSNNNNHTGGPPDSLGFASNLMNLPVPSSGINTGLNAGSAMVPVSYSNVVGIRGGASPNTSSGIDSPNPLTAKKNYKPCSVANCKKYAQRHGLCRAHEKEGEVDRVNSKSVVARTSGTTPAIRVHRMCCYPECTRHSQKHHVCRTHEKMLRVRAREEVGFGGDVDAEFQKILSQIRVCRHPSGCSNSIRSRGLCMQHLAPLIESSGAAAAYSHDIGKAMPQQHSGGGAGSTAKRPRARAKKNRSMGAAVPANKNSSSDSYTDNNQNGLSSTTTTTKKTTTNSSSAPRTCLNAHCNNVARALGYCKSHERAIRKTQVKTETGKVLYYIPMPPLAREPTKRSRRSPSNNSSSVGRKRKIAAANPPGSSGGGPNSNDSVVSDGNHAAIHPVENVATASSLVTENTAMNTSTNNNDTKPLKVQLTPKCPREGCNNAPGVWGTCDEHYVRRCDFEKCSRLADRRGLCLVHRNATYCKVPGCKSIVSGKQLCTSHLKLSSSSKLLCCYSGCKTLVTDTSNPVCPEHANVPNCGFDYCIRLVVGSTAYCEAHASARECSEADCTRLAVLSDKCESHGGSYLPTVKKPPRPRATPTSSQNHTKPATLSAGSKRKVSATLAPVPVPQQQQQPPPVSYAFDQSSFSFDMDIPMDDVNILPPSKLLAIGPTPGVRGKLSQNPSPRSVNSSCSPSSGRRSYCKAPGCPKMARTIGLCGAHGGGRRCSVPGCSNISQCKGKCKRHNLEEVSKGLPSSSPRLGDTNLSGTSGSVTLKQQQHPSPVSTSTSFTTNSVPDFPVNVQLSSPMMSTASILSAVPNNTTTPSSNTKSAHSIVVQSTGSGISI